MKLGRKALARTGVAALLVASLLAMAPAPAHATVSTLSPRKCDQFLSGDKVRRLDVCARIWYDQDALLVRSVVEMHTYELLGGINDWVDSRSQSITMNFAETLKFGGDVADWGQDVSQNCRVNGPGGSVACSVPNTIRVAFYGPALYTLPAVDEWQTKVVHVSWRDDRGVPHPNVYPNLVSPPCQILLTC